MFLKLLRNWNFIKKDNTAQVFSCYFYGIFLKHLFYITFPGACAIVITWITNFLRFSFFWLTRCIYGSFGSLCICFCFTLRVLKIIQIVLTLTKFVLYVSWLKSCHLVFFFESMNWFKKEKKREKFSECFTHGSGKTIKVFNQVFSNMSWATKLKFSSTILQYFSYFIRVAKVKKNKSAI